MDSEAFHRTVILHHKKGDHSPHNEKCGGYQHYLAVQGQLPHSVALEEIAVKIDNN